MPEEKGKRFTINGKEYHVPILNVNQNVEVGKILRQCGLVDGDFSINRLLEAISENRELHHFLATIIVPVNAKFDQESLPELMKEVGDMDSETMCEVIESFFGKNERWTRRLEIILAKRFPALATNTTTA